MSVEVRLLDWDSKFFEIRIGRAVAELYTGADIQALEAQLHAADLDLAYCISSSKLSAETLRFATCEWLPADVKVTFTKSASVELDDDDDVSEVQALNKEEQTKIEDLAIQSGVYSRFHMDPKIPHHRFEALYRTWIRKSLSGDIALKVLVVRVNGQLAGFVTLGENSKRGDIGIIAVDHDFRGRGLGRRLMQQAEKWFALNGYDHVQVVTQQRNKAACKLYESCGYHIGHTEHVYHVWRTGK